MAALSRILRARFTVRRLMVGVAIVALALGGTLWGRVLLERRDRYLYEARWQAYFEEMAREAAADVAAPGGAKFAPAYRAMAAYHAERKGKYLRAAARPWVIVEPDPNPPVDPMSGLPFMPDHPYGPE